jgi:hypothetical protein
MKAQLPRIAPSRGVLVWEVAMSAESTDRPGIFLSSACRNARSVPRSKHAVAWDAVTEAKMQLEREYNSHHSHTLHIYKSPLFSKITMFLMD